MKLFLDLDVFFLQCHAVDSQQPGMLDQMYAVQQHDDLICVSYAARDAGLMKNTAPEEAKRLFPTLKTVHVPRPYGSKTSYKMYRGYSRKVFDAVRKMANARGDACTLTSIDECYLDVSESASRLLDSGTVAQQWPAGVSSLHNEPFSVNDGEDWMLAAASTLALEYRELIASLGFRASICVAKSCILAKAAIVKPNQITLVSSRVISSYMSSLYWTNLPYCGVLVKKAHRDLLAEIKTCADVLQNSQQASRVLTAKEFEWLMNGIEGEDVDWWSLNDRAVPESMMVQMSLDASFLSDMKKIWHWIAEELYDRLLDHSFRHPDVHPVSLRLSARKLAEKEVGRTEQAGLLVSMNVEQTYNLLYRIFHGLYSDGSHNMRWVGVEIKFKSAVEVAKVSVLQLLGGSPTKRKKK